MELKMTQPFTKDLIYAVKVLEDLSVTKADKCTAVGFHSEVNPKIRLEGLNFSKKIEVHKGNSLLLVLDNSLDKFFPGSSDCSEKKDKLIAQLKDSALEARYYLMLEKQGLIKMNGQGECL